jgi:hypothetical protein
MKSIIFWDMTLCSPLSVNRRFGGTYRLHLQVWRVSQATIRQVVGGKLLAACLLAGFCWTYFFDPEDGGHIFLRNVGWHSTDYTASYSRRWYSSSHLNGSDGAACLLHPKTWLGEALGDQFELLPRHWLSWLKAIVVFFRSSCKMQL